MPVFSLSSFLACVCSVFRSRALGVPLYTRFWLCIEIMVGARYRGTCGIANDMNEPERKREVLAKTLLMMIVSDLSRNATNEAGPKPGPSY
jgi:hypothetical protein